MALVIPSDDERPQTGYLGLIGLLLGLALGAVVLDLTAGPPHLPAHLPSWATIETTLRGSSLPLGIVAYVLGMAAWAVWLWIVGSLLLRATVLAIETMSRGAVWVHVLRTVSDRLTLPVVRRAVDGALVTVFVVNVVSRTIPGAAAASLPAPATPHVTTVRSHAVLATAATAPRDNPGSRDVTYTVQPGDTLWGIAERFYGTGEEFPRLVAANVGRQMGDGERFTRAGVIQPGWLLDIPLPSQTVTEAGGAHYYVVEEGDTLQGIAARLLGNADRWPSLFATNRGTAEVDGRALTDPDVIWPGLRLKLPSAPSHAATAQHPPAPEHGGSSNGSKAPRKPPRRRLSPTPVEPTPTPISPSPSPRSRVAVPTPGTSGGPHIAFPDGETDLIAGVAGAAAIAAGGAILLARRRVRRSLSEPPVPAPPQARSVNQFADADPARALVHRLHSDEAEPITGLAMRVRGLLAAAGIGDAAVIWAEQARNAITLTLCIPPADQERVQDVAAELGRRLGGKGRAFPTRDHDLALHLSDLSLAGLSLHRFADRTGDLCLFPLGISPHEETLYANWDELGHVVLSGPLGGGTEVILTSLVASLTARRRPGDLHLWTIADRHTLSPAIARLPHHVGDVINSSDEECVRETLALFRRELDRRIRSAERQESQGGVSVEGPEMVLVVGELADLPDDGTTLALIGRHGASHRMRLLAATARVDSINDDVLSHFETRLVLQTLSNDESIRLIGRPDGTTLGDGEFYLRIDGRESVRLRGFRVSTEHLEALVRLMGGTYGGPRAGSLVSRRDGEDAEPEPHADAGAAHPTEQVPQDSPVGASHDLRIPVDMHGLPAGIETEEREPAGGNGAGHALEEGDWTGLPEVSVAKATVDANGHQVAPDNVVVVKHTLVGPGHADQEVDRPRIEVRCFGDFVVTAGDREVNPSSEEGVSYKAWEVLAFLAVHPGGAVAKEKIIAAVWPDADPESGGGRLRTALKRLRALFAEQVPDLSSEVVRSERDGTRRLDTSLISSDVHEFVALLRAVPKLRCEEAMAALQRARDLYQGDLLSGRAAGLFEWADEREVTGVSLREHYREEYYRATQQLARLHYQDGHADLAVPLHKELLKAEPTLEDVVRELYRCYQQVGNLQSLIREDRHLRQALRDAYAGFDEAEFDATDIEPEPETTALFKAIRQELGASRALPQKG